LRTGLKAVVKTHTMARSVAGTYITLSGNPRKNSKESIRPFRASGTGWLEEARAADQF
jgi:hypothetical protein